MPATGSSSAGMESGCPALHLGEDGAVLMGARVRLGGGGDMGWSCWILVGRLGHCLID